MLKNLAAETGRPVGELISDVLAGYVEDLAAPREMLDSRYDDIKSGKVKLVPGEEVFARLLGKSAGSPVCDILQFSPGSGNRS